MATIKIKFRPSTVSQKEGTLYFRVIHNRVVRQLRTFFRLYTHEWNQQTDRVMVSEASPQRKDMLLMLQRQIEVEIGKFRAVVGFLESQKKAYTADQVLDFYRSLNGDSQTVFTFMRNRVLLLKQQGKVRTSETYAATLRSFVRFRRDVDLQFTEMDAMVVADYEVYLHNHGVSKNTSSFYMRILRAAYNRAVDDGLVSLRVNPFKHVYTGIDKTVKRAVALNTIRSICDLDLLHAPKLDFARDMFLFSFYTRGMSFVDMAYLEKTSIRNGILTYRRKKTGQQLVIRWEKCMQRIVDKYDTSGSPYLLPLIRYPGNERMQYQNAGHLLNCRLKVIGQKVGASIPLTMYVARHSWASVARSKNVPLSVISEGMGHDSDTTTRIYLASLDTAVVDKANRMILNSL